MNHPDEKRNETIFLALCQKLNSQHDQSMRCIASLARSWPEKLAGMVNGVLPYLMRAKN